ncbi:MAG: hypothetical protein WKH64_16315 [Chloroflexia bacterium]
MPTLPEAVEAELRTGLGKVEAVQLAAVDLTTGNGATALRDSKARRT